MIYSKNQDFLWDRKWYNGILRKALPMSVTNQVILNIGSKLKLGTCIFFLLFIDRKVKIILLTWS